VFRRRDRLIMELAGQLAYSRAREAALTERLAWYQAAKPQPELRIVRDDDVRDSAQLMIP
jgi:hypothetical protein